MRLLQFLALRFSSQYSTVETLKYGTAEVNRWPLRFARLTSSAVANTSRLG